MCWKLPSAAPNWPCSAVALTVRTNLTACAWSACPPSIRTQLVCRRLPGRDRCLRLRRRTRRCWSCPSWWPAGGADFWFFPRGSAACAAGDALGLRGEPGCLGGAAEAGAGPVLASLGVGSTSAAKWIGRSNLALELGSSKSWNLWYL